MVSPCVRAPWALVPLVFALGCESRQVTVRVRPPPSPEDGGEPAVFAEIFRDGERCVVVAAAPLDNSPEPVRATAYRTRGVVRDGAPSCLGAPGEVLLEGLSPSAAYLVEMVVLDPSDYAPGPVDTTRERVVSLQDLPLPNNPEPGFICLSDPTPSRVWPPILARAVEACRAAPLRDPCALTMPEGGVCPAGSR